MGLAAAAIIAGGAMQSYGQIKQGQMAEAQGKFTKAVAMRNQQALNRQAKAEMEAARSEESRISRKEKIAKASQRASSAKSGFSLAGASLEVLTDTAYQFSLDKNLALRRGVFRSQELIERGELVMAQGRWARTQGKQAKKMAYLSAGGTMLMSAGMAKAFTPAPTGTGYNPLTMSNPTSITRNF